MYQDESIVKYKNTRFAYINFDATYHGMIILEQRPLAMVCQVGRYFA